jgi:hypothetical protein
MNNCNQLTEIAWRALPDSGNVIPSPLEAPGYRAPTLLPVISALGETETYLSQGNTETTFLLSKEQVIIDTPDLTRVLNTDNKDMS